MCPKVLKIYHQTFRNGKALSNSAQFSFQRIYKTKQSQSFRVKLIGVTGGNHNIDSQNLIFLKNLPEFTTYANFEEINAAGVMIRKCDLYLGNLNDRDFQQIELMVDEIPLTPFIISCENPCSFCISFQIELIE